MITLPEARIHAHICADGYTYISIGRRNKRDIREHKRKNIFRKHYHVRYSNSEPLLKNLFKYDVKDAYNRKAISVSNNEVEVEGKWIFYRLRKMGALDSYNWRICPKILNGTKELNIEWLKAFFDDEGTVDLSRNRVRAKSVNKIGLKQAQEMLTKIGIISKTTGPNCDNTWYLTINKDNLRKFYKLIGFRHSERNKNLNRALNIDTKI